VLSAYRISFWARSLSLPSPFFQKNYQTHSSSDNFYIKLSGRFVKHYRPMLSSDGLASFAICQKKNQQKIRRQPTSHTKSFLLMTFCK